MIFESTDHSFRIAFPAAPNRTEGTRMTWGGRVDELEMRAVLSGSEFIVQVRELPRTALWLTTESFVIAKVKNGFLMDGKRPELSDDPIRVGQYPGRRLRYRDPERDGGDWIEDAVILLAKNRLYFVVVGRSSRAEGELPIETFFRSFEVF